MADLLFIFLSFIEGFALLASPCIFPMLPIILTGSLLGSIKRPIGIITGFVLSFSLFVFFARWIVNLTGIDLNLVRNISYALLALFALFMISNTLTKKINIGLSYLTPSLPHFKLKQAGFLSGFFLGSLLALVWAPCAGPILAAIVVQTVLQQSTWLSFISLIAFALGAALPMFIISLYGRQLMHFFNVSSRFLTGIRQTLGWILLASVCFMLYQERYSHVTLNDKVSFRYSGTLQEGLWFPYQAPPIGGIETWLNSPALNLDTLKGKVVLIDFWTYSCINCVRTIPYLNQWYQRYHQKGLVIIGIHSPEFDFEKKIENVRYAVHKLGIMYPVALDNQFVTWRNFKNHYWPAHYLIDKTGKVVYQQFGEGNYGVTENNIQFLLGLDELHHLKETQESYALWQTPETYLGYHRANPRFSPLLHPDQSTQYVFPKTLSTNAWALQGLWTVKQDKLIAMQKNASIKLHFHAAKVYMVMGSSNGKPIAIHLSLKEQSENTQVIVDKTTLYQVVWQNKQGDGVLTITSEEAGLELYTFTFSD